MYTTVKGLKVNYINKGSGDKLILLHGWGADAKLYSGIIEFLSKKYEVFAPDLPGFGDTEEPPTPYDVSDFADFVIEFANTLKIKKSILLGHSHGGRIIIEIAAREKPPIEIEKIILVGSAGIKPKKTLKQKTKIAVYKISKRTYSFGLMKRLFPKALENLRKRTGSADYNAASPVMRQSLVKVVNSDYSKVLYKIKTPTLLIWGDKDTATPISDGERMESLIPGSGLAVIKGGTHYCFLEQPCLFNRIIGSFLKIQV